MTRRLVLLAVLPLLAAACGSSHRAAPVSTVAATTTERVPVSPAPMTVIAYFLRDAKIAPVPVHVPRTRAVATAALGALLNEPPVGYGSAVPADGRVVSVTIEGGIATATLSGELRSLTTSAEAQIVYTLTQFPSVTGVGLRLENGPLPITDDHGAVLTEPATRADFEGETPAILVSSPLPGDRVTSPLHAAGTANTFEATFQLELDQNGAPLAKTVVTASSGTGQRGTFAVDLPFTGSGPATVVAYELSAADGSVINRVEIPVTLARG
jgi:hypothetical protein